MKSILSALVPGRGARAEALSFKSYRHTPFQHLEFEILESWLPVENGNEWVFTDEKCRLPQLFFQTVGKTAEFDSAASFVDFLRAQKPGQDYGRATSSLASGFRAVELEYEEAGENLQVFALIVDVGEGILWFSVKTTIDRADDHRPIVERLRTTLSFR